MVLERVQMKCIWSKKEDDSGIKCPKTRMWELERKGPDFFLIPDMSGMLSVQEVFASGIFILHINSKKVDGLIPQCLYYWT